MTKRQQAARKRLLAGVDLDPAVVAEVNAELGLPPPVDAFAPTVPAPAPCADVVKVTVDGLRLENPLNRRQGWRAVWSRGKAEKHRVQGAFMRAARARGMPTAEHPWIVTVTRCGPGTLDHHDALPASCKHVVDAVAEWIGVDDKRRDLVRYQYEQRRERVWSVEILVEVKREVA